MRSLVVTLVLGALVPAPSADVRRMLVSAKAEAMSADYRADLAGLAALRGRLTAFRDDPELGYLAAYWSGYASWRIAMNGAASARMSRDELITNLERAAADFEASIATKDGFADAYAAAASVHGWLLTFYLDDLAVRRPHAVAAARLLARAKELEPANVRVLWVEGGNLVFRPAAYGGDFEAGMAVYRTIVATAGPLEPDSPFPDWGKAEAVMSLAYGHLNQAPPDLGAAAAEAREALRLEPRWFYVRNVLIPRIEAHRKGPI
jgi:hypothetical protein